MAKKWVGDDGNLLPAQQIEPYRLWFEFLKLATKDPKVKLNHTLYKAWGPWESLKFDEWWEPRWRSLFALDLGVRQVFQADINHSETENFIAVLIPLHQKKATTLAQVKKLLETKGGSKMKSTASLGRFQIKVLAKGSNKLIDPSRRFLRNLGTVRLLLNLYRFWIKNVDIANHRDRIRQSSRDFFAWAKNYNDKTRYKRDGTKSKRPQIYIPPPIVAYVKYLELLGEGGRISRETHQKYLDSNDSKGGGGTADAYRQLSRYFSKAEKLATNVGKGIFPGSYE